MEENFKRVPDDKGYSIYAVDYVDQNGNCETVASGFGLDEDVLQDIVEAIEAQGDKRGNIQLTWQSVEITGLDYQNNTLTFEPQDLVVNTYVEKNEGDAEYTLQGDLMYNWEDAADEIIRAYGPFGSVFENEEDELDSVDYTDALVNDLYSN